MKKIIPYPIKQIAKKIFKPKLSYVVPTYLANNFIQINELGLARIEKSIRENYHTGWRHESNFSKQKYERDLNAHLYVRLKNDRHNIIPWLDSAIQLKNKHILEIGCGTGSSTIALSEQGAVVTGIDVDEGALLVAKDRANVYGLDVDFRFLNAKNISAEFQGTQFDIIIFFACLEHMTISERLTSLANAWEMLSIGGLLVIVETPNRLWYHDAHTSLLPFFHWLPNELAFTYSKFSSRENFNDLYNDYTPESKEHFLRRGRGMSFHELEATIGKATNMKVISSLSSFKEIKMGYQMPELDKQYKSLLLSFCPYIHEGFFNEYLDLIIEKS